MGYFLYTSEGVREVLGLRNKKDIRYYVNKAKKAGLLPSKTKGGVEYFDVDVLLMFKKRYTK